MFNIFLALKKADDLVHEKVKILLKKKEILGPENLQWRH